MLYDPKWKKMEQPVLSIHSLVAWLRAQKPNQTYNFTCTKGTCLFSLYMSGMGVRGNPFKASREEQHLWGELHARFYGIAADMPWTFGAALKRAEAVLAEADEGEK